MTGTLQAEVDEQSARAWIASRADFFDASQPVLVARAPGRLDVMGGIADYSGSLVLELPLAVATWVAVQAQDRARPGDRERRRGLRARQHPDRGRSPRRRRCPTPRHACGCRAIRTAPGRPTSPGRWWCCSTSTRIGCGTARRSCVRSRRTDRQGGQLVGGARGRGVRGAGRRWPACEIERSRARARRAGGREPGRRRAVRRDGPDDRGLRPRAVTCSSCCASRRRWSATLPLPPGAGSCSASTRASVTRCPARDYGSVRAAAFMGYRIVADAAGLAAPRRRARARGDRRSAVPRIPGERRRRTNGARAIATPCPNASAARVPGPLRRHRPTPRPRSIRRGATRCEPRPSIPVREHERVGRFRALLARRRRRPKTRARSSAG